MKKREIKRTYIVRLIEYVVTFAFLVTSFFYLRNTEIDFGKDLDFVMEILSLAVTFFIGIVCLVVYYSKKLDKFLFFGLSFFGVFLLDLYHSFIVGSIFDYKPLGVDASWESSRYFLAVLMIIGWLAWDKRERRWGEGVISKGFIFWGIPALFLFFFIFFQVFHVGEGGYSYVYLKNFLLSSLFLLAFALYFSKGEWKRYYFEHFVVLFLLVSFVSQAVYVSYSVEIYDTMYDTAHFLALVGYFLFLFGVLIEIYFLLYNVRFLEEKLSYCEEEKERLINSREKIQKVARDSWEEIEKALQETEKGRKDLEKMNQMMVGREIKMIELKKEIIRLKKKCGESKDDSSV